MHVCGCVCLWVRGCRATHPLVGLKVCLCARQPPFSRLHHSNPPPQESNSGYPFISGHFSMPFTALTCTHTCTCTCSQSQSEGSTYICLHVLHPVHSPVTQQPAASAARHPLSGTVWRLFNPLHTKDVFPVNEGGRDSNTKGRVSGEVANSTAFYHQLLVIFPDRWVC